MPLSLMDISISSLLSLSVTVISPLSGVNLIALLRILYKIWWNFRLSAVVSIELFPKFKIILIFFFSASGLIRLLASSIASKISKVEVLSSILPDSIFDKSSKSLIIPRRCNPLALMSLTYSACFSFNSPKIFKLNASENPIIAFKGVLSS